ncbi:NlpC/P60 family protein [Geobacter pickeringii]|uniref:Peptidoglycan-binding protein n=1 Tax=Geobacter pickeringii TaxID=345632 RepID=A0A0B5BI62_9BACT|nr:NlpC/P60 family protein [Geobacter pickeringii]AJE03731.1 peptidoglycan-binding protein [Geobacter pickeringii]
MSRTLLNFIIAALICFSAATGCATPHAGISRLGYAIQVGAFSDVKNAERLTARLQVRGIEAFYFKRENGFYAVRFGDFPTKEAARTNARKLVSDGMIGAYFIAPPQAFPSERHETVISKKAPEPSLSPLPDETRKKREPARGDRDMGAIAARTAERFVGIPYRWGGDTVVDGMDCSGFARAVYNLCGVSIPRTSREQFRVGDVVGRDDLKDGDLVFFGSSEQSINHVGIYIGDGKFVHAPRRGDDIKISSLEESYFTKKFMGGRRYF